MARISVKTIFVTSFLVCLLAAKVLCSPENSEDFNKYPNDEEGDDEDDFGDDKDDTDSALPPVMMSEPLTLEVHSGERVDLPCATANHSHDATKFAVRWEKDGRTLYLDTVQSSPKDPRIIFYSSNSSLVVTNVTASDSGHYYCIYSSQPPVKLMHEINVFAPAAIRRIQPKGPVSVEKGFPVTLKCDVTGYPRPAIEWKKWVKRGHPDEKFTATSESVILDSVGRHDSGTYQCIAKNDQGSEASAQVSIHVTYAPEIDIEEELVASGKDYEAMLKCVVHAEPKAKVYWVKDNVFVNDTHTFMEGNRHYYHIKKTQDSDFGKYKCIATNSKGTTNSKEIELTGRPMTPIFVTANLGGDGRSLDVKWRIISYSPILEYSVQYKNKKDNGKWRTLPTPVEETEDGNVYKLQYQLKDLPVGDYWVSLMAKNFYGWTNPAEPYSFTIKNESHEATAENSKMEGGRSVNDSTRPRITAVLMIISFCAFFL